MAFVIYMGEKYYVKNGILSVGSLGFEGKGIESIDEIEGLENLTNLQGLNLQNNQISEIAGLKNLIKLKVLLLGGNKIEEIKGLDSITKLEFLNFERNDVQEIKGTNNIIDLRGLFLWLNLWYNNPLQNLAPHEVKILNRKGIYLQYSKHAEARLEKNRIFKEILSTQRPHTGLKKKSLKEERLKWIGALAIVFGVPVPVGLILTAIAFGFMALINRTYGYSNLPFDYYWDSYWANPPLFWQTFGTCNLIVWPLILLVILIAPIAEGLRG